MTAHLGAQLWLEPRDTAAAVRRRVRVAAEHGMSTLRVFLLWPWLEPRPGEYAFGPHDAAFDAAAECGIGIRATLSPESRPWHLGVSGQLQSTPMCMPAEGAERDSIDRFVGLCVRRYATHPALAQWILWNEPQRPFPGRAPRDWSRAESELQCLLLQARYGDVAELNRCWLTGYASFEEVPHPSRVASGGDGGSPFFAVDAWRVEADVRAAGLQAEIERIAAVVRSEDPRTPLSLNPPGPFDNWAAGGFDLDSLAAVGDVMGTSIHAPWHLTFAPATDHLPLVAAGVSLVRAVHPKGRAELTEMQGGDVLQGAPGAQGVSAQDIASAYLAASFAGAEATMTWTLNPRTHGFEAGDWGMLHDDDTPGESLALVATSAAVVRRLDELLPGWAPAEPEVLAVVDRESMAFDWIGAMTARDAWGVEVDRAGRAAAGIVVSVLRAGRAASVATAAALSRREDLSGTTIVVACTPAPGDALVVELRRALGQGARLVIDALSLRYGADGRLASGAGAAFLAELGVSSRRLRSPSLGAGPWPIHTADGPAGGCPGPYCLFEVDDRWRASADAAVAGVPLLLHSDDGLLTLVAAALSWDAPETVRRRALGPAPAAAVAPLDGLTHVQRVVAGEREAHLILRSQAAAGRRTTVCLPPGRYRDLWADADVDVPAPGVFTMGAGTAVAVLMSLD